MKKILIVLSVLIVFGFIGGCGDPDEGIPEPKSPPPVQQLDEDMSDQ
jgi:hypothetical protein